MRFTTPLALILLLCLPYFFWLGRSRLAVSRGRRWRDRVSVALRLLIVLLLVLSLAGTETVRAADDLAVVFLVDGSDSVDPEQLTFAETYIRDSISFMGPNDQAAVIVFGANALVERPMSGLAELAPITSAPQTLQTDLAEAIRLGLALFPAGSARRMVIISDGAATVGDAANAARLAADAGVQISYVPLTRPVGQAEALITSVDAPTRVSEGEAFSIRITVESSANMPATLRVLAGGAPITEDAVLLRPGTNNFTIRLRAAAQEFTRYQVELVPADDIYVQNNTLAAFTEVVGAPRLLVVAPDGTLDDSGNPVLAEAPQLVLALEAAGFEVDLVSPADLSASLAELSNYASIIMVNVNAKYLTPRKMETLQTFVRDLGGGLVVVGGPESYGMGGYFRTPLEETLPVDMQIKDQERFPAVSIVIVIDRSGSMGAQEGSLTKIQLAAEGAVRVVELLNDLDEITVIPVDTAPDNPIGPASMADREAVIAQIRTIGAGGGGIYVRTGLEAAADALANTPNQVQHIILLSDGNDSEEKDGVEELVEGLVASGITVSVVSIGNGIDTPWLRSIAELGGGRFHLTDRASNLPEIFTQETTSIQRSYLVEERFFPSLSNDSPILSGIAAVPPLYGYVGTAPKDTAEVILETHQGDPLLAAWQYGLGRAVAWTSDATGRWAADWVRWEGFPVFWAQAVRWTITQDRDNPVETTITLTEADATLTVDARDSNGAFLNNMVMEANVVTPDGATVNLSLQQVAPGRYEAAFQPDEAGAYFIRVAGSDGSEDSEVVVGQTSGWVLSYSPEYRQFEADPAQLALLAELGGGADVSGDPALVFTHDLPAEAVTRPIWPWLLLAATLLLPLDIALRRLVLTRTDMERAWAASFGRLRPAPPPIPAEQAQRVSRLFQAKQRAGTSRDDDEPPLTFEPPPTPPPDRPDPPPSQPDRPRPTPPDRPVTGGSPLASRLLQKKREREQGDE